ncbi:helix-turn-helix domain-containing protein, partial [Streptomyces sp. NPDC001178]
MWRRVASPNRSSGAGFSCSVPLSVTGASVRIVQLRYAFRLDPTPGQRIAPARAFGCARVVYSMARVRPGADAAREPPPPPRQGAAADGRGRWRGATGVPRQGQRGRRLLLRRQGLRRRLRLPPHP